MPTSIEQLLKELTKEVRNNTEAYIGLETTVSIELNGLRKDYDKLYDTVASIAAAQGSHSERITVSEAKVGEIRDLREEIVSLRVFAEVLRKQVEETTPMRTPWTAVVSAAIAVGALLWTVFGQ